DARADERRRTQDDGTLVEAIVRWAARAHAPLRSGLLARRLWRTGAVAPGSDHVAEALALQRTDGALARRRGRSARARDLGSAADGGRRRAVLERVHPDDHERGPDDVRQPAGDGRRRARTIRPSRAPQARAPLRPLQYPAGRALRARLLLPRRQSAA